MLCCLLLSGEITLLITKFNPAQFIPCPRVGNLSGLPRQFQLRMGTEPRQHYVSLEFAWLAQRHGGHHDKRTDLCKFGLGSGLGDGNAPDITATVDEFLGPDQVGGLVRRSLSVRRAVRLCAFSRRSSSTRRERSISFLRSSCLRSPRLLSSFLWFWSMESMFAGFSLPAKV